MNFCVSPDKILLLLRINFIGYNFHLYKATAGVPLGKGEASSLNMMLITLADGFQGIYIDNFDGITFFNQ